MVVSDDKIDGYEAEGDEFESESVDGVLGDDEGDSDANESGASVRLPKVPDEPAQDQDVTADRAAAKAAAKSAKSAASAAAAKASAVQWTKDDEELLEGVGRPWKHQKMFMLADTMLFYSKRSDMPNGGATIMDKIRVSGEHTMAKKIEQQKPRNKKAVVQVAYLGANNADDADAWEIYKERFEAAGFTSIRRIRSRLPKKDERYLRKADVVVIASGDGARGWAIFEKTDIANIIWDKWEANDVIVGVGAGASQMAYGVYQQWTKDKFKRLFDRTSRRVAGDTNISESELENPFEGVPFVTSDSQLSSEVSDWEPGDETLEQRRARWEARRLQRSEDGTRVVQLEVPRSMLQPYSSDSEFSASTRSFSERGPLHDDQNYYKLIGANPTDSDAEVARLTRVAKIRTHPDKHKGDPRATEKFQLVVEAAEVLTDEEKRRMYDQYGMEGVRRLMYTKQETRGNFDDTQEGEVPTAKPGMMRWRYNFTYCWRMMPLLVGYGEEQWDWVALKWCLKEVDETKHGLLAVGLTRGSGLGFTAPVETNGAGIMEPIMHPLVGYTWKRWEDWENGGTWHESILYPETRDLKKSRILEEREKREAARPRCRVCGKKGVRTKEEAARAENTGLSRLMRCAKCHMAHYCSRDHQREDWPNHRAECQKIRDKNAPPEAPKLRKGFFGGGKSLGEVHQMDVEDNDSNDAKRPMVFNEERPSAIETEPVVREVQPYEVDRID